MKQLFIGFILVCVLSATALAVNEQQDCSLFQGEVLQEICNNIPDCPEKQLRGDLPRQLFCNLPDKPSDFAIVQTEYKRMRINIEDVSSEYWMQPEWNPQWMQSIVPLYRNLDLNRMGVPTLGVSPAEWVFEPQRGENYTVATKVELSVYTRYYLGVSPVADFPDSMEMQANFWPDGNKSIVNPKDVSKYFKVVFDEDVYLFEPTYPQYGENYAYQIRPVIYVDRCVPKGRYGLAINFEAPPKAQNKEWILKYKNLYDDGQYLVKPFFKVFMEVSDDPPKDCGGKDYTIAWVAGGALLFVTGLVIWNNKAKRATRRRARA